MSKDPIQVLDRLTKKQTALINKVEHLEKTMQGIMDEFTDFIDTLAGWTAAYHAKDGEQMHALAVQTETLLTKMRLKYG